MPDILEIRLFRYLPMILLLLATWRIIAEFLTEHPGASKDRVYDAVLAPLLSSSAARTISFFLVLRFDNSVAIAVERLPAAGAVPVLGVIIVCSAAGALPVRGIDFHGRSFLLFIGRAPNKASVAAPEYEPTSGAATKVAAKHTCLTIVPRCVYAVASNVGKNIAVKPAKCPKRTIPQ